jgi:hypothetical protein
MDVTDIANTMEMKDSRTSFKDFADIPVLQKRVCSMAGRLQNLKMFVRRGIYRQSVTYEGNAAVSRSPRGGCDERDRRTDFTGEDFLHQ